MCLSVLKEMAGRSGRAFLSAGTGGIDGNSDSAGVAADSSSPQKARKQGLNIDDYLARNDSNGFLTKPGIPSSPPLPEPM
ncbi:MAG: hypothetical protein M0Z56_12465 [Desulfobacteraceae bacterium]|nr:hypothetical protein [Desulfobacteraceae bacterium]